MDIYKSNRVVKTVGHFVQWKIDNYHAQKDVIFSNGFQMCNLNWSFVLKREHICLYLDKYTNRSAVERLGNPIVSLAIWVFSSDKVVLTKHELKHQTFIPVVVSNALTIGLEFEVPALPMKFDIEIEIQDLKSRTGCPLSTVEPTNIYIDNLEAKMLRDGIHTDIEIKIASFDDLRVAAHAGVLAAMSPVFMEVLPNPLPERKPYIYTISNLDISFEASKAFINYFYGKVETREFLSKMEELAQLAEHYQVTDLLDRCDESLQRYKNRECLSNAHTAQSDITEAEDYLH